MKALTIRGTVIKVGSRVARVAFGTQVSGGHDPFTDPPQLEWREVIATGETPLIDTRPGKPRIPTFAVARKPGSNQYVWVLSPEDWAVTEAEGEAMLAAERAKIPAWIQSQIRKSGEHIAELEAEIAGERFRLARLQSLAVPEEANELNPR